MRDGRGRWNSMVVLIGVSLLAAAHAADKRSGDQTDNAEADFLEYLGSVEGKDDNWTDIEVDASAAKHVNKDEDVKAAKGSKPPADEDKQ